MELAKFTQWDWSNIVLIMVSRVTFLYFSLSLSLCVFARSFVVVWSIFRWTRYCTSSSASMATRTRCSLIHILLSSLWRPLLLSKGLPLFYLFLLGYHIRWWFQTRTAAATWVAANDGSFTGRAPTKPSAFWQRWWTNSESFPYQQSRGSTFQPRITTPSTCPPSGSSSNLAATGGPTCRASCTHPSPDPDSTSSASRPRTGAASHQQACSRTFCQQPGVQVGNWRWAHGSPTLARDANHVLVVLGDPFWGDSAGSGMNQLG